MSRDLFLAIDVGTGGLRSALVDRHGTILAFSHKEHEQIVPQFGWSEQRPAEWWAGTRATIRDVIGKVEGGAGRVAAICACGQMHGSVLIDDGGNPTLEAVPLWNDKRTVPQVDAFIARHGVDRGLELSANMPAPAWPAFKIAWIAEHEPAALARSSTLLMPKDWINFKLTGERAQDFTEASLSYLMDWRPPRLVGGALHDDRCAARPVGLRSAARERFLAGSTEPSLPIWGWPRAYRCWSAPGTIRWPCSDPE